jgi:type I restriction enzyme, S subunit
MSKWKECTLGDIIKVKHGFAFKGNFISTEPNQNILVTPGNISIGGGFKKSKFKYYKGDFPKDYILKENDIVVTMTDLSQEGDTLGYSAKIPKSENGIKYLHNQRIGLVQFLNDEVNKDFIHWVMRTYEYQGFILGAASGTSIRHTSPTTIREYTFLLPPLPTQKAIANTLSSLDAKIDLLTKQNQTFEQLAQTLFRQWFIEEKKESWAEKSVSDFGKIVCGKTPSKKIKDYFNGNVPFIKIPDMHNKTFVFNAEDSLTEKGANSQLNKLLPPYSICVSCIATVGLVTMNVFPSQTNQQINSIIPNEIFYRYFLFLFFKQMKDELLSMASGGTATDNLNTTDFSKIKISVPKNTVFKEFDAIVTPYFNKINSNSQQIKTLTNLRDTLLPKLMNGEVTINN